MIRGKKMKVIIKPNEVECDQKVELEFIDDNNKNFMNVWVDTLELPEMCIIGKVKGAVIISMSTFNIEIKDERSKK